MTASAWLRARRCSCSATYASTPFTNRCARSAIGTGAAGTPSRPTAASPRSSPFPKNCWRGAGSDPRVAEVLMREEALFAARRQTLAEQTRLIEQQAQQADDEPVALRRQIAAESRALGLQREELDANAPADGAGLRRRHARQDGGSRRGRDYEARISERQAELAKARQRGSELALRVKTLETSSAQAAADELKESGNSFRSRFERLRRSDAAERQRIAAPIAGCQRPEVHLLGAVVGPCDAILDRAAGRQADHGRPHPPGGYQPCRRRQHGRRSPSPPRHV